MKIADTRLLPAGEGCLRYFAIEHGKDLLVRDSAHLMVLLYNLAILITDTTIAGFHQRIACVVLGTDIAVDSSPALVTFASVAFSYRSFVTASKRATSYEEVS